MTQTDKEKLEAIEKLVRGDRGLMYTIGVGKSFTDYENVLKDVLKIIEAD